MDRAGERIQDCRRELRQQLARTRAACRVVAAVMPSADAGRDNRWIAITEAPQCLQCFRILVRAGEHQVSRFRQVWALLEQNRVVLLDRPELADQRVGKRGAVIEAHEYADRFEPVVGLRQIVDLVIVDHLQPMLEATQEPVCGLQSIGHGRVQSA